MIQTLVNKEWFMLSITETRLGCHLMQRMSHVMKNCIQGVIETLGIQMKMTSCFIWQEVAILLKKGNIKKTSSDALWKLFQLHAAPEVDMEQFDDSPLNYHYFMVLFGEVVETKIEEPRGRLTRLIKLTTGEARELIKHCIQLPHNGGYQHARALLERTYVNFHKILFSYRKEIKEWSPWKFGDVKGFRKSYNFLLKCESLSESQDWNAMDSPEMDTLSLNFKVAWRING